VPISALRFGINGGPHRLAITGFTPIRLDLARFIGGEVLTRIDTNKHEFLIEADDPNPVGVTY